MNKVLTLAVNKGGVGKTTTALSLAYYEIQQGKRVLLIDLDTQGSLTLALTDNTNDKGALELLQGERLEHCITPIKGNLDLVHASLDLINIKNTKEDAYRLKRALKGVKGYDVIIIDTPPTSCELQYNGIMASTGVIVPLLADRFSLRGLDQIIDTVNEFKADNKNVKIEGFILCQYDNRASLSQAMKENLIRSANRQGVRYLGTVRNSIAIKEAITLQADFMEYAPKSNAVKDYTEIAEAIFN